MLEKNKGFTLIELLVVIAVIGLLAGIALISVNNVRKKSRDSKRIADLRQIQLSLELYYDKYGYYPEHDGGTNPYGYAFSDWGSHCGGWWCDLENFLSEFVEPLPRDPNGETQLDYYYNYRTHGGGRSYGLSVRLEIVNDMSINDGGCRNERYEVGPSLTLCGCSPETWYHQGTDLCP